MPETHVQEAAGVTPPPEPEKATTRVVGGSPVLMIPPPAPADEGAARKRMENALTEARWAHPSGVPELNPYHGAHVLLAGWDAFRRVIHRDVAEMARVDPWITGRVDPTMTARVVWQRLKLRLWRWCAEVCERPRWGPREVVWLFENHYVGRPGRPRLRDEKWRITEDGRGAGIWDGWSSSGLVREGTYHELIEEMNATPEAKNAEHAAWEEQCREADELHG